MKSRGLALEANLVVTSSLFCPILFLVLIECAYVCLCLCGVFVQVEHIIREEKMMAAQEIIELFCELITVRLPIIEVQRFTSKSKP